MNLKAAMIREFLNRQGLLLMPCCFDALAAKLIERAGFNTFCELEKRYAHMDHTSDEPR